MLREEFIHAEHHWLSLAGALDHIDTRLLNKATRLGAGSRRPSNATATKVQTRKRWSPKPQGEYYTMQNQTFDDDSIFIPGSVLPGASAEIEGLTPKTPAVDL